MPTALPRRTVLATGLTALIAAPSFASRRVVAEPEAWSSSIDPELAARVVGMSHFNLEGVTKEVERRPELARACTDWGFGDYESAIGAASHVGRFEIAQVLIANGARPTLFTHAMMGHLEVVRATVEASPALARTLGPHGITLVTHARAGGERARAVLDYLRTVDGADAGYPSKPLADASSLHGRYEPSDAGPPAMIVGKSRIAEVTLEPEGGVARNLVHLGDRVFLPAGAGSVRIRFAEMGGEMSLVIETAEGLWRFIRSAT